MYSSDKNANIVINKIRDGFATMSEWFYEKYMDLNPDKYHFLTLGFNESSPYFSFNDTTIENVTGEKILG